MSALSAAAAELWCCAREKLSLPLAPRPACNATRDAFARASQLALRLCCPSTLCRHAQWKRRAIHKLKHPAAHTLVVQLADCAGREAFKFKSPPLFLSFPGKLAQYLQ